jgi:penicillin-insensitive murein endopeptidase
MEKAIFPKGSLPAVLAAVLPLTACAAPSATPEIAASAATATAPSTSAATPAPQRNNRYLFDLWAKIRSPFPGDVKSIGAYAAGCLAGAHELPLDGPGFSVMRPKRLRYFGTPELVDFIETLGKNLQAAKLPRLLVGDMGGPRGGPMKTGHSSHQIGLDVDLWFRMSRKKPSMQERETWSAESFVKDDRHLSRHWGNQERKLVELAATSPYVERIFVHPAIKKDLCVKFGGAPWLYKMRPWWAHQDHLHVRLYCPKGSATCKSQEPLTVGNNECGKELDWWFTQEAKDKGAEKDAAFKERQFPELPAECDEMVKGLASKESQ